jgi:hypothetical protein
MTIFRGLIGVLALGLSAAGWAMNDNQSMLFFGIVAIALIPR